jgi:oxalate decarboxylase
MTEQDNKMSNHGVSRRSFLGQTSAALVAVASLPILAAAQQTTHTHGGINEQELGPKNPGLEAQEPDSVFPPSSDAGGQPPFKYPFALSHRRIESGGWTRQVTVRDFPLSKRMAGVEMRLISPQSIRTVGRLLRT